MTPELQAAANEYARLMRDYELHSNLADSAKAKVTGAFADCMEGRGNGPDAALVGASLQLQSDALAKWALVTALLKETFGKG